HVQRERLDVLYSFRRTLRDFNHIRPRISKPPETPRLYTNRHGRVALKSTHGVSPFRPFPRKGE
ncbi:MAG TPA: hypothetical protein PLC24_08665, partial [Myxococcota bacterium]|nr:hypothetical protein [Myxococcota bacterium]